MKILPILLINLVMVGGALVIYDQMQSSSGGATYDMSGADPVDLADIETRLARLESREGQPALAGGGNESILRRLEALERSSPGAATVAAGDSGSAEPSSDAPSRPDSGPITSFSNDGDITEGEVSRFRKLMDAANEQRRLEREREALARTLEQLDIEMDDQQKEQYLAARQERRRMMGEMWQKLRENRTPDTPREEIMEQMNAGRDKVNEAFAITLNKFLPTGDATKLVNHEGNNRWGSMRRGGDRGGRSGR